MQNRLVRFGLVGGSSIWIRTDAILSIMEQANGHASIRLNDGTMLYVAITASEIIERMNLKQTWKEDAAYERGDDE